MQPGKAYDMNKIKMGRTCLVLHQNSLQGKKYVGTASKVEIAMEQVTCTQGKWKWYWQ